MTSSPTPSRREQNRQRSRQSIIKAAQALLAERGFGQFTAQELAERAGLSRATLFRYFESVDVAVVAGFYEQRLDALRDQLTAAPAELGPMAALIWAVGKLQDDAFDRETVLLEQARLSQASANLRAHTLAYQASYETELAAVLGERFAELTSDDPRPRLMVAAFLALLRSAVDISLDSDGRLPLSAMLDVLSRFSDGEVSQQ